MASLGTEQPSPPAPGKDRVPREVVEAAYARLRAMASGHFPNNAAITLQPTALVNEALLRVMKSSGQDITTTEQLCAYLSTVMRSVLVDHARSTNARRRREASRAGHEARQETRGAAAVLQANDLVEHLARNAPKRARIVEYHYFGGLSPSSIASLVDTTSRAVKLEIALAEQTLRVATAAGSREAPAGLPVDPVSNAS